VLAFLASFIVFLRTQMASRSIYVKVLALMPINVVFPYVFLMQGFVHAYSPADIAVILGWGFLYNALVDVYVLTDEAVRSGKLDLLAVAPSSRGGWLAGMHAAVFLVYLPAIALSWAALAMIVGIVLPLAVVVWFFVVIIPTAELLAQGVFVICVLNSRAFNLVTFSLDGLQVLSCIIYPLTALPLALRPVSAVLPTYLMGSVLREPSLGSLLRLIVSLVAVGLLFAVALRAGTRRARGGAVHG